MVIEVLASIMGVLMSLGYYPQAYTILKKKSSKNVSKLSYLVFAVGTTTWLTYGIIINSLPIILSFVLGVVGSWLVLLLIFIYDKKE